MRSNWASAQQTAKASMNQRQSPEFTRVGGLNRPRKLQDIDWNQGVQWVYSTTTATNFGVLSLFQIYFANDCPNQAYITMNF